MYDALCCISSDAVSSRMVCSFVILCLPLRCYRLQAEAVSVPFIAACLELRAYYGRTRPSYSQTIIPCSRRCVVCIVWSTL
jgi:hypothetical protein